MGVRKTTEQFQREVFDLVEDEYIVVGEYVSNSDKILFLHNVVDCMREFQMRPRNFLNGQRCPTCVRKDWGEKHPPVNRMTTEQFKRKVYDLVGDEYAVEGEYVNTKTKIKIKHNLCETVYETTPGSFLRGSRCTNQDCLHKRISTGTSKDRARTAIKERFDAFSDEYEVLDEYKSWKDVVRIRHKTCGCIFERTPSSFFNNTNRVYDIRCPNCMKKHMVQLQSKTQEQFERDVFDMYGDEYTVIGEYVNSEKKITVQHNKCGHIWDVRPGNLIHGTHPTGCPICNESRGERTIRILLKRDEIEFEAQKTFIDLIGVGGGNLSYDFYIPEYNLLVEYQGEFHDGNTNANIQTEEDLEAQKEHDRRKRQYAKDHNINLLEIWYWDFDNIETILTDYFNSSNLLNRKTG